MSELKDKTVKGVAWSAVERFSAQGIQFVFNILIARILLPEDYGVVAMLNIFLAVSQTFIDSGFSNALIRKQDRTDADYNTVFWFNLAVSVFFCALLWLSAPAIASFYKIPLLTKVTRILSLTLVIGAFGAVQGTRLSIRLDFKTRAVISIITITVMGIVGLWMARHGYGVWALVVQNIAGSITRTVFLWLFVKWKPKLIFSKKSFKDMFGFGSKLLATGLINTVYGNIYSILIGKFFAPASLGLYNRAESFAIFPSANLYGIMQNVSYPVLCSIQNEKVRLKEAFRKFITLISYISFPAMVGLSAVADPLVRFILTDKWAESIPLLQILCFSFILYPIGAFCLTFPNVVGRSDIYLKQSIISKCIDLPIFLLCIPFGVKCICFGKIGVAIISLFINTYFTNKLIGYSLLDLIKDIFPIILFSGIMWISVHLVMNCFEDSGIRLLMGITVGLASYWALSKIFRNKEYEYIKSTILSKISDNK